MSFDRPFVASSLLAGLLLLAAGCATSDYGRITHKIASYESRAIEKRRELDASNDPAIRLACLNDLINTTESQLKIARRINPQSNPEFRSKALTLAQASEEKTNRVKMLEQRLQEYRRQRDAIMQAGTAAPARPAGT